MTVIGLPCVVDTNVTIIANGQGAPECVLSCARALLDVVASGHVVLDDQGRIYQEYKRYLSPKGQPGAGDAFFKWLLTNQGNPARCTRVPVTPQPHDPRDFKEFPADPALSKFDPSDRVFVAVSRAHPMGPPIFEASDSKWWGFREALANNGVQVVFLCQKEIQAVYERKTGGG
jgi:hypothetical protein